MPVIFDRVLPLNLIANTAIFYIAARLYLLPFVSRFRPQQILVPILLLQFNATSGDDVPDPRRNVSRITAGVRLSGSVRRPGDSNDCVRRNPARVAGRSAGQADSVDIQHFRNARSARGDHHRDHL